MKKSLIAAALMGAMTVPGAALAQDAASATAPDLTVGGTVYGPEGGVVGTIKELVGGNVVVDTGKNTATLAGNAFAKGPNGPVIGMTKAQLDAAIEQAAAKADAAMAAALVPNAQVRSSDGVMVGTVKKIEGNNVVITIPTGAITLQKKHLTADQTGLKLFMTSAQFQSAINAAAQADAAKDAALVAGADVHSKDGVVVGTIDKIEGENVFIKLADGAITLTKEHLNLDNGQLKLFMTAEQFKSAVAAAKAQSTAS